MPSCHVKGLARLVVVASTLLLVMPPLTSFSASPLEADTEPEHVSANASLAIPNMQWPMFGKDAQHTANAGSFARRLSDPLLLWSTSESIESHGMSVGNFSRNIGLNNTPSYDRPTLHTVFAQNGLVTVAEAATGRTMWQAPLGGILLGAPALSDLNGNGRLDLVVTSSVGNVTCYEPDIIWNGSAYSWSPNMTYQTLWERSLGAEASYSSPATGDVTGDGVDDVAVCAGRTLHILNGLDGSVFWNASLPGNIATSPVLVKYGTGGLWVAVQSFNHTGFQLDRTYLTLINNMSQESWNKSISLSALLTTFLSLPSPAVADLDGDSIPEMAIVSPFESGTGRLYAFEQDGSFLLSSIPLKGQCEAPPAIGDFNGDSSPDIVTVSWNFSLPGNAKAHVGAFDGRNGNPLWSSTIDRTVDILMTERSVAGPAIADISRDGRPDVVLGLFNGRMYGLNGTDGAIMWEFNNTIRASVTSSPSLADVQLDGFPEVLDDGFVVTERIGDLIVGPQDISFSNDNPAENANVSVTAFVHNNGTKNLNNVSVLFSDIYDNATVWTARRQVNVSAGGSFGATVTWNAQGGGAHNISVAADPDNLIEEISEQNNRASRGIRVSSHYTVEISCQANESYVDAGNEAAYLVRLRNAGDGSNTINLTVSGLAPSWTTSLSQTRLTLQANESATVTVKIDSPSDATAGAYPANVTARSESSAANRATVVLTTRVRGLFGVMIDPRSNSSNAMPDDWITYVFNVSNSGNSDDTLLFANTSPPAGWVAQLEQDQMALPGRSHMLLNMLVHPPYNAAEGESATIEVTVRSTGDATKSDLAVVQTTVVLPDMAVESVKFYRADGAEADGNKLHLVDGGNATVNVTVRNIRENVQVGGIWIEVTEGTVSLGHEIISMLPMGQNGSVEIPWRPSEGLHSLVAFVDSGRTVSESNEDNNNMTAGMLVKSGFASGQYIISGTITSQGGAPVSGAAVSVRSERTGQSLAVSTDGGGGYSANLNALSSGYQEEDLITVSASDGITTCSTTFLAYSEDGGKDVDITLTPGPYDFDIKAEKTAINTDPQVPAVYKLWFRNLGAENNTLFVNNSAPATGWTATLENSSGVRTGMIVLGPAHEPSAADSMTLRVTPPQGALAGARQQLRVLAMSTNQTAVSHYSDTVTTVNQVFSVEISFEKGPSVKPGESARYNFTVRNGGNGNDTIDLTVAAPAGLTAALNRTSMPVGPFASVSTWMAVNASFNAIPGPYNISVMARSRLSPTVSEAKGNLSITVETFTYKLQLNGGVDALMQEDVGKVHFSARNAGNMRDTFSLSTRPDTPDTLPSGWTYSVRRNGTAVIFLTLEPGELAPLELWVETPQEMPGMSSIRFNITGESQTEPDKTASTIITLSIERPDLLILGTVRPSVSEPRNGQNVRLSVTVINQGIVDSPPFSVAFFDGGKAIGNVTAPALAVNSQTDVTVNWTAKEGTRSLKATVNPASGPVLRVKELSYENNDVTASVIVKSAQPAISWALIGGFAAVILAVVGAYVFLSRKGRAKGRRKGTDDEDEAEEDEGDERPPAEAGGLHPIGAAWLPPPKGGGLLSDEEAGEEEEGGDQESEDEDKECGDEEEEESKERETEESEEEEEEASGETEKEEEEPAEGDDEEEPAEGDDEEEPAEGDDDESLPMKEEVHDVEAVHVVVEEEDPGKVPPKKVLIKKKFIPPAPAGKARAPPPKKGKLKRPPPPLADKEVEMPSVIRIG